jgi:hypothetical protein
VNGLSEQLATIKASNSEKATSLEREIQMLKAELEEGKITKAKELEGQRSNMQGQIDQINKLIEERETKASVSFYFSFSRIFLTSFHFFSLLLTHICHA